MKDLTNTTIWITGASSGIGEAMAYEFSRLGAQLVLSARNEEKLNKVKANCEEPEMHFVLPFDVTDEAQTEKAYLDAVDLAGSVDWLFNNAGVSQRSLILETSEEVERQLMEINYFAQTRLTRLVLPSMIAQGGGKVIMVSSIAGLLGTQYRGAYSAAKAALHMWANSLRAELHDKGIGVATVFPGFVTTNVSINALTGDGSAQGTMDKQTHAGMKPNVFAKQVITALMQDEEYIVMGGKKEMLATIVNRLSPQGLYKVIRRSDVT